MIPLRDNIRARRLPLVNYALIASCAVVFVIQLQEDPRSAGSIVARYGMTPERVLDPSVPAYRVVPKELPFRGTVMVREEISPPPIPAWLTALTCIFLHGGWLHFLGNMWFLYIFGDNVEDCLGHAGYLGFYLVAGIGASLAHLLSSPDSSLPTVGASGAIAGVMGAYLLLYPKAHVLALVPLGFFLTMVVLPAPFFLGFWFFLQFFQGSLALTAAETAGVAWWAHIGGFVIGAATVLVLRASGLLRRRDVHLLRGTDRSGRYRFRRRQMPWDEPTRRW